MVEPLPTVFELLKNNYGHLHDKLVFVNAAISSNAGNLAFWTLHEDVLNGLSLETRVIYLQKSSFNRDHILRWLTRNGYQDTALKEIRVLSISMSELLRKHWDGRPFNLGNVLVIG